MVWQRLFGKIGFTLDLDLKGLWDIRHQQVDQTRNEEDEMLQSNESQIN